MKLYPILQRVLFETASTDDKIVNPVTGRKIFVRSALGYPHISPAYKAAAEYVEKNNIPDPGQSARSERHGEVEKSIEANKTAGPYDHVYHHSDGKQSKIQSMHWEDPERMAYHAHQAEIKRQAAGPQEPKPRAKSDKPRMKRVIPAKLEAVSEVPATIEKALETNKHFDVTDARALLRASDDMNRAGDAIYKTMETRYGNPEKIEKYRESSIKTRSKLSDGEKHVAHIKSDKMIFPPHCFDRPTESADQTTFDALVKVAQRFHELRDIRRANHDKRPGNNWGQTA